MDSIVNSLDRMVQIGLTIGTVCILFYVVIGRVWFRKRRRMYWAGSSVGNALQQLQATARPSIEYQLEEKLKEKTEEDDQSGPDNPGSYYRRLRTRDQRTSGGGDMQKDETNPDVCQIGLWPACPAGTDRRRESTGFWAKSIRSATLWTVLALVVFLVVVLTIFGATRDKSPHTVHFVTVDNNVKLEVLDWGGSGRALVLLAGLGNTAHIFDDFAPKLTSTYHMYGITRRGFGASGIPKSGYSADRLGDDILQVIDVLGLTRPILVGHSIAGGELSSVGSRHPEKVAGLVYLEAGYSYAYYDRSRRDAFLDTLDVKRKLEQLLQLGTDDQRAHLMRELLNKDLSQLEKDLKESLKDLEDAPPPPPPPQPPPSSEFSPSQAILDGAQKYTKIPVPVLAIYAFPPRFGPEIWATDPAKREAVRAKVLTLVGAQVKAFEMGVPSAHVVTFPDADHFIFRSNEADVLREINLFASTLK
jgi:non-heme chloroperoxidase